MDWWIYLIFSFLNVQVYTESTVTSSRLLMWTQTGKQAIPQWNYANVQIGNNDEFAVVFEVMDGDDSTVEIAIDDVSFTPECRVGGEKNYIILIWTDATQLPSLNIFI